MTSILHTYRAELIQYLNVANLKPHLLSVNLLTLDEYQQLRINEGLLTDQAQAEKLLDMIVRKGPKHEELFMLGLQKSTEAGEDIHLGHVDLLEILKEQLKRRGEAPPIVLPVEETAYTGISDNPILRGEEAIPDGIFPVQYQHLTEPIASSATSIQQGVSQYSSVYSYPVQQTETHPYYGYHDEGEPLVNPFVNPIERLYDARSPVMLGDLQMVNDKDWHKTEELKYLIVTESQAIIRKYGRLVFDVCNLLKTLNVSSEDICLQLVHMGYPIGSTSQTNLTALMTSLHSYSSWFNYEIIEVIADDFGGDAGRQLITRYEENFKNFLNKVTYRCPQYMSNIPQGFEGFLVKVDAKFESFTLQDVTLYKTRIVKLTGILPQCLLLRAVEEGCVLMSWFVPANLVAKISERMKAQVSLLARHNIVSFCLAGENVDIQNNRSLYPDQTTTFGYVSTDNLLNIQSIHTKKYSSAVELNQATSVNSCDLVDTSTLVCLSPDSRTRSATFEYTECTDDETNKQVKTSSSLSQLECRPPKLVPTKPLKQSSEQTESLTLSPDRAENAPKGISLAPALETVDLDKASEPVNTKPIARKRSFPLRFLSFFHSFRRRSNSESVKGLPRASVQIDKDRSLKPPLKHRSLTVPMIDFNPHLLPSISPSNDKAEINYINTTAKRSLGSDVNSKECQDNAKKEQIHFPIGTHLERSGNDSMDSEDSSNYPLKSVIETESMSRSDSPLSLNRDSPLSLNHDSSQSHLRERSRSVSSPTAYLAKKNASKLHQTNRYSIISTNSVRSDSTAVDSGYGSNEPSLITGLDHVSQLNLSEGQSSLSPLSENNSNMGKGNGNDSVNLESKSSPLADDQHVSRGHSHYTAK